MVSIQSVEFRPGGTASLVIAYNGTANEYSGAYAPTFDREPSVGAVTYATITIEQQQADSMVLSRANFGLHSGVSLQKFYHRPVQAFLPRIDPRLRFDRD